jgi:hypothetical protein
MGYDIIDVSQPITSAEAPTTYHQASAAFVNPMGYDEVESIETTRSRVRSIFSGSSNQVAAALRTKDRSLSLRALA